MASALRKWKQEFLNSYLQINKIAFCGFADFIEVEVKHKTFDKFVQNATYKENKKEKKNHNDLSCSAKDLQENLVIVPSIIFYVSPMVCEVTVEDDIRVVSRGEQEVGGDLLISC